MKNLIFLFLIISGCNDQQKETPDDSDEKPFETADYIKIYVKNEKAVYITPKKDSVYLAIKIDDDTVKRPSNSHHFHYEISKRFESKNICDSLTQITFNLITKPSFADKGHATDYVGDYFSVFVVKGGTTFSTYFESVDDWTTATPQTSILFNFLMRNKLIE